MRPCLAFTAVCLLAVFAACGEVACARAASSAASPVVAACANPKLPPEILGGPLAAPASPLPTITAVHGDLKLDLAVANDESTRDEGLMCVTSLAPRAGMIFVFPQSQEWTFWMKNTLIPLDMVWFDDAGTVTTIAADVPASTRTTPDAKIARRAGFGRYVVELGAGQAAQIGMTVGERFALPSLQASH